MKLGKDKPQVSIYKQTKQKKIFHRFWYGFVQWNTVKMSFFGLVFLFLPQKLRQWLETWQRQAQVSIYKQIKQKKIFTESNKGLYCKIL